MAYLDLGGRICGEVSDEVARSIIEEIRTSEAPNHDKMRHDVEEMMRRILERETGD